MFKVQTLHQKLLEKVLSLYLLGIASMLKLIMPKIFVEHHLCWIATEKHWNCLLLVNSRISRLLLYEKRYDEHHWSIEAQRWFVSINFINVERNSYQVNSGKKNNYIDEWHRKLGHFSPNRLDKLSELNSSIPTFDRKIIKQLQCVPCLVGKAKRSYFPSWSRKAIRPLELIHLHISGPVESSLEGYQFTAASFFKTLKKKSKLSHELAEFKHRAEVELQMYGTELSNIRLDRAGENLPNTVKEFCSNNGMHLDPSPAYAPKATVVLKDLFKKIGLALVCYFSPPTYPSTYGLKQSIMLTGYAIVSLLLALTTIYPLCIWNLMLEVTTNHV